MATAPAAAVAATQLPLNPDILIRILGSFLFINVHLFVVAFALVYSTAGLMHLSRTGTIIESVLVAIPVIALSIKVLLMAIRAERDPDNN